jgi:hypothetical protein
VSHLDLGIAKPDGSRPDLPGSLGYAIIVYAIEVRLVAIAAFRCS